MSCACCDFKSAIRPFVMAEREEGGVKCLSPEESKRILDEASRESSEGKRKAGLSSRVVEVAPTSPKRSEGGFAPPRVDREAQRAHVVGESELLDELNLTRTIVSIKKSNTPVRLVVEALGVYECESATSYKHAFPSSEERERQRLRAVQRGVVATVATRLASAVFPY
ncbi:MAG: hypothetical protein OXF02_06485 [Simkaniaceae bacterium]|nr:hypothetical protein [Simkaniaceae bacterium]